MSDTKKIIKNIIDTGFEAVKDSAKQVAGTVAPGALLEQAIGVKQNKPDELTEFLKKSGPDLTPEEIAKKKSELGEKDSKELEETRKFLTATTPEHMKLPPKEKELTPYEEAMEEERKKAQQVEMQKKAASQASVGMPTGKQQRGGLFAKKKRPAASGFETSKNIKVG